MRLTRPWSRDERDRGGLQSGAPLDRKPRCVAQDTRPRTEWLQGVQGGPKQPVAFAPRTLEAEQVHQGRLAPLEVLAGALAHCVGGRFAVEEVVGNLEGGPQRSPEGE